MLTLARSMANKEVQQEQDAVEIDPAAAGLAATSTSHKATMLEAIVVVELLPRATSTTCACEAER